MKFTISEKLKFAKMHVNDLVPLFEISEKTNTRSSCSISGLISSPLLDNGGWLHIYPEGSMWEYYRFIRPFKKGIAHLARMSHKPIVPIGFSYRKPSWIRKALFKQPAVYNLCIGEPIFLDESLTIGDQEIDFLIRCHKAVSSLAGITEQEDIYEPIFNNNKKIDF